MSRHLAARSVPLRLDRAHVRGLKYRFPAYILVYWRSENMPIYWAISYYLRPGNAIEYQRWLNSEEARQLFERYEKETGWKYLNTYFPILGLGDYDCEDWYVVPDWASVDKMRESKAFEQLNLKTWDFIDQTRPQRSRVMRTARDVIITEPPKK